jgi:biopolymer transport protein ExbD
MSFGGFDSGSRKSPMVEINTTPLVDVMLVLLIIFIITAPLLTHTVKIDLPEASSQQDPEKPDTVTLAVDANGLLYWNNQVIADAELESKLQEIAGRNPQPELHLRAEKTTQYEKLAQIMSAAQTAGVNRMGFVTVPEDH